MAPPVGRCAVCGADLDPDPMLRSPDRQFGIDREFSVHVCATCGAGNTRPRAGFADLEPHYPAAYGAHGRMSSRLGDGLRRLFLRRELRLGSPGAVYGMEPGRILDVGCGGGTTGSLLIQRGWQVDGIEPSEAACAQARELGVRARQGTLETVPVPPGSYDVVLFHQSLEHMEEPLAALRRAHEAVVPGGLVLVSVPNFDCWGRRHFGDDWFHLDLPRHRVHFEERSLRLALESSGLQPVRVWSSTSNTGLVGSLQYRLRGRLLGGDAAERESLGRLVALALIPVSWIEQVAGGGRDLLHAVARRP